VDETVRDYENARQGDSAAYARLTSALRPEILRFLRDVSGPDVCRHEGPQDLVQRVFKVLQTRMERLPHCHERKGVLRIFRLQARREIANTLMRLERTPRGPSALPPEPATPTRSRGTVTRADDKRKLEEVLAAMKPEYAAVLRCCVLEEMTRAQAAAALGISEENVKKRLARARGELRALTKNWRREENGDAPEGTGTGE